MERVSTPRTRNFFLGFASDGTSPLPAASTSSDPEPYPCTPEPKHRRSRYPSPSAPRPRRARRNAALKLITLPRNPEKTMMPLAGIALAPLLVSPPALRPSPRGSVAAEAARRPRARGRVRCSAAAASGGGGGGDAGELSRATLLWRAAKLPIYSVALVPLTVSSCNSKLQKISAIKNCNSRTASVLAC